MKNNTMKFIKTDKVDIAEQLRVLGYTELLQGDSATFCFINDGKTLTFDAEKNGCVYTNLLCI